MLTDVPNIFTDYGSEEQKPIIAAHPETLIKMDFPAGSMGPKVRGACEFVHKTGKRSAIGQLSDLTEIMAGTTGTLISNEVNGIVYAD